MACVKFVLKMAGKIPGLGSSSKKYKEHEESEFFQGVGVTKNIHYSLLLYCIIGLPYRLEFLERCN